MWRKEHFAHTILFFLVLISQIDCKNQSSVSCSNNNECPKNDLCIRGHCRNVYKSNRDQSAPHGNLPDFCFTNVWPNAENCVLWNVDEEKGVRTCESNSIPPYFVEPYCPFGLGEGYCNSPVEGDTTDCTVFHGMTCPCVEGSRGCPTTSLVGDVVTPIYQRFEFPLHPDPTREDLPKHMYDNNALQTGIGYQVIGAHLNGIQIKGPAEANGFNVDTSLIPLPCGGHVTPPVGPGPNYHYHKAADCETIEIPGDHGPLIGYASDGFGIYGYGDYSGMPLLDECHGHFGRIPATGEIAYHYHTSDAYNLPGVPHKPYFMGCLGPSRGRCNSTVNDEFDFGANWCGSGCGFDVCVQPGTDPEGFYAYLNQFETGMSWLDGLSINNFE